MTNSKRNSRFPLNLTVQLDKNLKDAVVEQAELLNEGNMTKTMRELIREALEARNLQSGKTSE